MTETYLLIIALFIFCYGVFRYAIEYQEGKGRERNQVIMEAEFMEYFGLDELLKEDE